MSFVLVVVTVACLAALLQIPLAEAASTDVFHTYGNGYNEEYAEAMIEHSFDNNIVMAGTMNVNVSGVSEDDFFLMKVTPEGVELWTKTYGDPNEQDRAYGLCEHSIDNGLLIIGNSRGFALAGGDRDAMLVKTDSGGVEQWTKMYGDLGAASDYGHFVIEHSIDNGLVLGLSTNAFGAGSDDIMLIKTDSVGVVQWSKTYGGTSRDFPYQLIEHSSGGFVIAGWTLSFGIAVSDCMAIMTDSAGVEQWTKTYGGASNEHFYSVVEHSSDNGLVFAGDTLSSGAGDWDTLIVKTDAAGVVQWSQTYGGAAQDQAHYVIERSEVGNGLLVVGHTRSFLPYAAAAGGAMFFLETDSSGTLVLAKAYSGREGEIGYAMVQHSVSNDIFLVGQSESYGETNTSHEAVMLVVEPSDLSGTAGVDYTSTVVASSPGLTGATQSNSDVDQTVTETVVSLSDVDNTNIHTAYVVGSASLSITPSISTTPSTTSSATASSSTTSSVSATSSASSSPSAVSVSVSVCDDNECVANATCVESSGGSGYACDCTTMMPVRAVGKYCNTTITGKPVSVKGDNCPGCRSIFVCTDSYDGSDAKTYTEGVIPSLAAASCICAKPSAALTGQFGAVQHQKQNDGSFCMEFTVYGGNPNATVKSIVDILVDDPPGTFTVTPNRPSELPECVDKANGCLEEEVSSDDSLMFILIGVGCFIVLLILAIVWYFVHKRLNTQFQLQDKAETEAVAEDVVVHGLVTDGAGATNAADKISDDELAPPSNLERRVTLTHDLEGNENFVPGQTQV